MRSQITGYPTLELHEEKILIVVKTYPRPCPKYRELVCTAGITASGKWIRLYPTGTQTLGRIRRSFEYFGAAQRAVTPT